MVNVPLMTVQCLIALASALDARVGAGAAHGRRAGRRRDGRVEGAEAARLLRSCARDQQKHGCRSHHDRAGAAQSFSIFCCVRGQPTLVRLWASHAAALAPHTINYRINNRPSLLRDVTDSCGASSRLVRSPKIVRQTACGSLSCGLDACRWPWDTMEQRIVRLSDHGLPASVLQAAS